MTDGAKPWREETVRVDGTDLSVAIGGAGRPVLVLHDELGNPGALKWNLALAARRKIITPLHPGLGRTPRADWIASIRDLAAFYARYLIESSLAPIDVIGFSLGGWIAGEMAACNPGQFRKMILVAPAGIRPPEGDILDFFQMMAPQQVLASVRDPAGTPEFAELYGGPMSPEQFEAFEDARAQTARLAWTPFMHNPALPHLLGVAAGLPTLVMWGKQDGVVPPSAAQAWQAAIQGARLVMFDACGHRPEIERSADFIREAEAFLGD
ncbi:MAG: alpha/beta fold hydrolase [Candidatus Binataceae bacterium]